MTDTTRNAPWERHGGYFFLSYAHSPPLPGSSGADPDQWVRPFFRDLNTAVRALARRDLGVSPGSFDQDVRAGTDWKAWLSRALGSAEVFVALYSPGYFARSWPGREWACYRQRMVDAGVADPLTRIVPVLWAPLPDGADRPELLQLDAGSVPGYAEHGLRALLKIAPMRGSYHAVLDRLARRIVELAEGSPVGPSEIADITTADSPFPSAEAHPVFEVTVAAPALAALPAGADPHRYGTSSWLWRPFLDEQELSLAEYAAGVAERLEFAAVVRDVLRPEAERLPGVALIDPWFVADEDAAGRLDAFVRGLPPWVVPLLVPDPRGGERADRLAERTRGLLEQAGALRTESAREAVAGVRSLKHFASIMPRLVVEAERQYFRHGPKPDPDDVASPRHRLAGGPGPSTLTPPLDTLGEETHG
ncbi:TIR-like protein FxsC [Microbispora sp. H13382]|uniref:TIR-like protein FxsC n=1 Tax=Microbispora sp. H13382 TaxID=2729112 RepID=UPI0016032DB5|nr:TIR-like protein FxsC [Microbispora sp. H13382]